MARHSRSHCVPWYLFPFWALFRLLTLIVNLTGRLVAVVLGFVFILVGIIISLTIIGAIVGIPLFIFGFMLLIRGLF